MQTVEDNYRLLLLIFEKHKNRTRWDTFFIYANFWVQSSEVFVLKYKYETKYGTFPTYAIVYH